ncbi:Dyp-type peroxidase [Microlunatus parietis]|uniref:Putative iron-dependent peroxidase n=1 Tax=Microlunatus parietis TaxID=682979 RepID=A0A7Y9LFL5_9ACTN|nr:Dyp-type peroxidase domain-containing protein [Microlunatus parietis]NYE74968.1 putative iron-dependent peroxidase [Microlunatus parietis]
MRHPRAQPVLAYPARAAIFLVLTVRPGGQHQVAETLDGLGALTRAVAAGGLTCVAAVGAELWDRLWPGPRPVGLEPLRSIAGLVHTAVATPGDLLFHLRGDRLTACTELAYQLLERLAGAVDVADRVSGLRRQDGDPDLPQLGDELDNPAGLDAVSAVQVGAEDPDHAGGSYVLVQRYRHDLAEWRSLPGTGQDPAARNGPAARRIVRDALPITTAGSDEVGSYLIAYASSAGALDRMLRDRFVGDASGRTDPALRFSTAVTGGLFFVPTRDRLQGSATGWRHNHHGIRRAVPAGPAQ